MPQTQRAPGSSPIWILVSPAQVAQMARSGTAWTNLKADADRDFSGVLLWEQDDKTDTYILAGALAYLAYKHISPADAATAETYRAKVQAALELVPPQLAGGPFNDDTTLSIGRNVFPLVVAASIIEWSSQGALDTFVAFCRSLLGTRATKPFDAYTANDGRSIPSTHEDRPNNWGTHNGASRMALALFLQDFDHFNRAATVFKGWLGDQQSYAGFVYDADKTWQSNQISPRAINPLNSVSWDGLGRVFDGCLPEEQRRPGPYPLKWGQKTNYYYEALQGVIAQAIMLSRQGRDVWSWSDSAIKRAFAWATTVNSQPFTDAVNGTDDYWMAWVLDRVYGTTYVSGQSVPNPTQPGKALGYCDWLVGSPNWP